jgi:hypothetical protein
VTKYILHLSRVELKSKLNLNLITQHFTRIER